jgi:uncharacterized RDD family membrane protein YckC
VTHDEVNAIPEEARRFQGRRAGIVSRVLANSIDFVVVFIALLLTYVAWQSLEFLLNPTGFTLATPTFIQALVVGGVYLFIYFTVSWATTGRTYGNHLMGLRVVNFRGQRVRWAGAVLRAAFCVTVPIGLFWAILSPRDRSLQDVVLRTSVVYDWSARAARKR